MRNQSSTARLFALLVGGSLVVGGIVGLFYESAFTSDPSVRDDALGLLSVNGWHNVVHIVTGLLGLAMARRAARAYAGLMGAAYTVVAAWGFIIGDGDSILSIIPVNTADNVLHLLIAVVGIAVYLTSYEPSRLRARLG